MYSLEQAVTDSANGIFLLEYYPQESQPKEKMDSPDDVFEYLAEEYKKALEAECITATTDSEILEVFYKLKFLNPERIRRGADIRIKKVYKEWVLKYLSNVKAAQETLSIKNKRSEGARPLIAKLSRLLAKKTKKDDVDNNI